MPQHMRHNNNMGGRQGGNNFNNRAGSTGRPNDRRNNMGYNNQGGPPRGNSMDGNRHGGMNMPMGGAMPAPEGGRVMPQGAPGMPGQQPQGPEQAFYHNTLKLVPSVVPANPHMKQQVGNAIFDFVTKLKGNTFAPKITGMLIDLPHEEIKLFLQNYGEFVKKVNDAGNLLQVQAGQAPQQPPQMMNAPPMQPPMQAPQTQGQ
jgi:hypothetical protein